jgi:hypothetical protein
MPLDREPPQRRLPDACLAANHDEPGALRDRAHQLFDSVDFPITTDQRAIDLAADKQLRHASNVSERLAAPSSICSTRRFAATS